MDCCEENEMPATTVVAMAEARKRDIEDASSVATKFMQYYYDMLQKKPHLVGQLYLEDSVMIWDGNPVCSRHAIQQFIERLPCLTFNRSSMDCQPLSNAAVGAKKTVMISISGQYRVSGVGSVTPYTQQIVITADNDKWRIATDNFRSQK